MREVVYPQLLMGVDGVIVDLVEEITEAVADFGETIEKEKVGEEEEEEGDEIKCSQCQLSNLMKVIPGLVQP